MPDQDLTALARRALHRVGSAQQTPAENLDLIDRNEVCGVLRKSRTASYEDPDVAALAIKMSDSKERPVWRWQRHEIVALVQARIAERDARAETVRAEVLARRERHLAKKRMAPKPQTNRGK